ncbi:metalloprotease TIKI2-like [Argiope bruennichi]|uniref:metalloprotease TIKI2-like n=1 Tax=Argiope bruennichi TaxID=94029 RepID=UPI00249402B3|nr:metalloprotease TIKI2-like [Argiope bruennichi]
MMVQIRWLLFYGIFCTALSFTVLAYKKPSFCDQDVDPFSFLWTIKRNPPSYLFGTIHVPYTKVWDSIPVNAKQAFATSTQVFFELDLVDPTTVSALSSCQLLPQGKNLSDVLPGDLYTRLKRHLEYVRGMMPQWMTKEDQRGRGLYADYLFNAIAGNWERKRPVWVMLMVNSLTESDVRSRGVPVLDLYLAQEAERLKKKTAAVEKVEEQCLPLNGLNFSQVLFALNHTLLQHELRESEMQSSYTTEDLIRHYNCGDLNSEVFGQDTAPVPNLSNNSLSEEDATLARNIDLYFRQELIYNRNKRMGSRVVQLMQQNPDQSLFFAFGAGHFLGNNTILDFVQDHGFEVEHVSVYTEIEKRESPKPTSSLDEMTPGSRLPSLLETSSIKSQDSRFNHRRYTTSTSDSVLWRSGSLLEHILYSSSPSPVTTYTPKRFNDLWVHLNTYGKKLIQVGEISARSSHVQPHQQAFQARFAKNKENDQMVSESSRIQIAQPLLRMMLLLLFIHYSIAFQIPSQVVCLTGIT